MSESDLGERTEEPTPEKRRRARQEGQFPRSRDGAAIATSVAVLIVLLVLGKGQLATLHNFAVRCFTGGVGFDVGNASQIVDETGTTVLWLVMPTAAAAVVGALSVGFLEAGFHPNLTLAAPKWERLNPVSKLKQLFSPGQGSVTVALSLMRVAVVASVTFTILKDAYPTLTRLARADLSASVLVILEIILKVTAWSVLALAALSLADYGHSWYRTNKELMMTRQELKEELRQQEGDPKIKARQRARAREIVKRGLVKEVRRSDVVVANPTHISVALRYRPNEGAPVVTAKGYDEVALYIRQLAKEHEVPVVENRPLARALSESVKVGRVIPVELYQAVAQVLAFVYRMKQKGWTG